MEHQTSTDPDQDLESTGDELEERIERLDDHIDDARQELRARAGDGDDDDVDVDDTDDDAGGEDPSGFDDPEVDEDDDEFDE